MSFDNVMNVKFQKILKIYKIFQAVFLTMEILSDFYPLKNRNIAHIQEEKANDQRK